MSVVGFIRALGDFHTALAHGFHLAADLIDPDGPDVRCAE